MQGSREGKFGVNERGQLVITAAANDAGLNLFIPSFIHSSLFAYLHDLTFLWAFTTLSDEGKIPLSVCFFFVTARIGYHVRFPSRSDVDSLNITWLLFWKRTSH